MSGVISVKKNTCDAVEPVTNWLTRFLPSVDRAWMFQFQRFEFCSPATGNPGNRGFGVVQRVGKARRISGSSSRTRAGGSSYRL